MDLVKKFKYNSPVILTYTFLSLLALILSSATLGKSNIAVFSVYRGSFTDPLFYLRLFTHVLGHADFDHFFNNFLMILLVGPMLEEKYGSKTVLITIIVTALFTGILHICFSNAMLLGASGVVFSLIIMASYANHEKGRIPITLILIIFIFIGREVFYVFTSQDNVARFVHIFGGMIGAVSGFLVNERK